MGPHCISIIVEFTVTPQIRTLLLRVMEFGDIDTSMDCPDGTPNLSGKQRMLMKQGKTAMSAKHKAMMAGATVKRLHFDHCGIYCNSTNSNSLAESDGIW